ncbi:hypothetical protein E2562_014716 [Oryza meyeriana var. granulata]|uniref:Uncharacterized protein n=1 Tax=Oryza meyeriana var. granulata TaxID=110450 RepID=A0A6G1BKJ4_9ORYZ|nr:hypothetical protein E2562_014716 [Oryza meyeriana var. granulata]
MAPLLEIRPVAAGHHESPQPWKTSKRVPQPREHVVTAQVRLDPRWSSPAIFLCPSRPNPCRSRSGHLIRPSNQKPPPMGESYIGTSSAVAVVVFLPPGCYQPWPLPVFSLLTHARRKKNSVFGPVPSRLDPTL